MRKYWTIFKVTWQQSIEYRAEFFGHMMLGLISLFVLIFIWKAVFNQKPDISGYTFSSMITYLIMVKVLHFLSRGNTGRLIADEIKEGRLSLHLVKPINYLKLWFSSFLADRSFETIMRLSIITLCVIIFPSHVSFPSLKNLLLLILFLPLALILNFIINIAIAYFAFLVTDIRLFSTSVGLVVGFLSGQLIPNDLFPGFLKHFNSILPFQYLVYFPIKIYQGLLTNSELLIGFFMATIWVVGFLFILSNLWSKGLKKYEAIGQ